MRSGTDAQSALTRAPRFVKNLVGRVRANGFSTNHGEWAPVQKMGALAMPILHQGRRWAASA